MLSERYAIGLDFGTLSGRALLCRLSDGAEIACAVYEYPHGVMDDTFAPCPGVSQKLPGDYALQHPDDYIEVLCRTIRVLLADTGVDPAAIVGWASISPPVLHCRFIKTESRFAAMPLLPPSRTRMSSYGSITPHSHTPIGSTRWQGNGAKNGWMSTAGRSPAEAPSQNDGTIYGGSRGIRRSGLFRGSGRLDRMAAHRQADAQLLHDGLQGAVHRR